MSAKTINVRLPEALYSQISGLGYLLLLTDQNGITVDYIGDSAVSEEARSLQLSM